nr:Penicillin binding protein transpeptidase domain protein [uncultured bacterium]
MIHHNTIKNLFSLRPHFKRLLVCGIVFSCASWPLLANNNCFIAKENGRIIAEKGRCDQRHSPFSTFKIAIALMGYESKILVDTNHPRVAYDRHMQQLFKDYYHPKKYPVMLLAARDQTPFSWMRYSAIWYSQYVTMKLGKKQFQDYVTLLNYGNKDVSGDKTHRRGLLHAWLGTSLQISPKEQVNFIERLTRKKLPVSQSAQTNTMRIMTLQPIFDDWQLHGKTGGPVPSGWFVGWIEKNGRMISFAQYIEQPENSLLSGGRVAKEVAIDHLIALTLES